MTDNRTPRKSGYIPEAKAFFEPEQERERETAKKPKPESEKKQLSPKTRKIILFSSVGAALAVVIGVFAGSMGSGGKDDDRNNQLQSMKEETTTSSEATTTEATEPPVTTDGYNREVLPQWQKYRDLNEDTIGWIKIGDTYVNYPVLQSLEYDDAGNLVGNNAFYLDHNFDKVKSNRGAIFADWHVPIDSSAHPGNTIVYGHNMADDKGDGKYFAYVSHYYAQAFGMNAYKNNPTITFETVYDDQRTTYKIFAGMFVNTLEQHGEVFNYHRVFNFADKGEFYAYVGEIMDRSSFYTDVDLEYGDELLTLSTCYYPFGSEVDSRFALFARRVRPGEDENVDVDAAYVNPNPKYFDYYYKVNGGSWKGRKWDTSKIKGFDEFYNN